MLKPLAALILLTSTTAAWGQSTRGGAAEEKRAVPDGPEASDSNGAPLSPAQLYQSLESARIVYLGEHHDRWADHQLELRVVRRLHPDAVGMEMFQRPFQDVLNRFSRHRLEEPGLREEAQWQKRWGFPWRFYWPIVEAAREDGDDLLALNTPAEVTHKVARQGLSSLSGDDLRWIPPIDQIQLGPDGYRKQMRAIFAEHSPHPDRAAPTTPTGPTNGIPGSSEQSFARFFEAQVLWDETMAASVADYAIAHPGARIVVVVGAGHIEGRVGIPDRVARRLEARHMAPRQVTVLLNPDDAHGAADYALRLANWVGP